MSTRYQIFVTAMIVSTLVVGCGQNQPAPTDTAAPPSNTLVPPTDPPTNTPIASEPTPIPATDRPADTEAQIFDIAWDDRSVFRQGLVESEQDALDRLPGASVYHIDFQISDNLLTLAGREKVHYTNTEDEPLDAVCFRLFPNAAGGSSVVSEVQINEQDVEPIYEFQDTAIRVPLPTALLPGEAVDIQMNFEVELPQEMAGNYGLFGSFDGLLVLDEFYPVIPVYDDEGWNVEEPPPNADTSYFDASFYLVRVTAPSELVIAASGIETGREGNGDKQVLTFAAGPARDFYLAAYEHYIVVSEKLGETTINSYTLPEWEDGAELAVQFTIAAFERFGERFGVYPYTEFDILSTPMLALGIEYPGITAILTDLYDLDGEMYGLPTRVMLESTVVHEAGHQWFYNIVGNDQIDEPWVDEAITQYVTGLYYADVYGRAAAESYRGSWESRWARVDNAEIPIGLPAGDYGDGEYGAIVYGRGPIFIATLAEEMGQETFDQFLQDYYESHKWGIGTGDAFKQLAEEHCQCDLTTLFEDWVYAK